MIYLFQSGAPSQLDLFDYKPQLAKTHGTDLPDSIRNGQRLTAMTAGQTSFPVAQSIFKFAQHGQSRRVAQRAAAAHRQGGRRLVFHQVDAHRADQSRSGRDVRADRLSARGAAEPGGLGVLRAGDDEPGPARVRRDDYRQRPVAGGAAVGHWVPCRAGIRESSCGRWATRCCMSRTRRASRSRSGHGSSTISRN